MSDKNNLNQARTLSIVVCHALNYFCCQIRIFAEFKIVFVIGLNYTVELKLFLRNYFFFCRWTVKHFFYPLGSTEIIFIARLWCCSKLFKSTKFEPSYQPIKIVRSKG